MEAPYDIILSGPITGVPDYKQRFAIAYCLAREDHRKAHGKEASVFNPAALPDGRTEEWYMQRCHEAIFASPKATMLQLKGWQQSEGCVSEHALAHKLRRTIKPANTDIFGRRDNGTKEG